LEILRDVFPDALISQDTEVLIVSRKYVEGISGVFFNSDEQ
jgi:hypothetical protein